MPHKNNYIELDYLLAVFSSAIIACFLIFTDKAKLDKSVY